MYLNSCLCKENHKLEWPQDAFFSFEWKNKEDNSLHIHRSFAIEQSIVGDNELPSWFHSCNLQEQRLRIGTNIYIYRLYHAVLKIIDFSITELKLFD